MRRTLLSSVWLLVAIIARAAVPGSTTVTLYFTTNSFHVSPEGLSDLEKATGRLPSFAKFYRVHLEAYADVDGETQHNDRLAARRADEVRFQLVKMGFTSKQIDVNVFGERKQRVPGDDDDAKAKNRAVLVAFELMPPQADAPSFPEQLNTVVHTFEAETAQTFSTPDGSELQIPASAFVDENGAVVKGKVELSYTSFRKPEDFAFSNIEMRYPMKDQHTFFESSGMFELTAKQNGRTLKLGAGKKIGITFKQEETIEQPVFYKYDAQTKTWSEEQRLKPMAKKKKEVERTVKSQSKTNRVFDYEPNYASQKSTFTRANIELKKFNWQKEEAYPRIMDYMSAMRYHCVDRYRLLVYSARAVKDNVSFEEAAFRAEKSIVQQNIFINEKNIAQHTTPYQVKFTKKKKGKVQLSIQRQGKVFFNENNELKKLNIEGEKKACKAISRKYNEFKTATLFEEGGEYFVSLVSERDSVQLPVNVRGVKATVVVDAVMHEYNLNRVRTKTALTAFYNDRKKLSDRTDSINVWHQQYLQDENATRTAVPWVYHRFTKQRVAEVEAACVATMQFRPTSYSNKRQDLPFSICNLDKVAMNRLVDLTSEQAKMSDVASVECEGIVSHPLLTKLSPNPMIEGGNYFGSTVIDEATRNKVLATENAMSNAMASLTCSELAVYNCDQISRIQDPLMVEAKYLDQNGKVIEPYAIRLMMSNFNGVLQYDGYRDMGPRLFAASASAEHLLLTCDEKGRVYLGRHLKFEKNNGSDISVVATIILEELPKSDAKNMVAQAVTMMNSRATAAQ